MTRRKQHDAPPPTGPGELGPGEQPLEGVTRREVLRSGAAIATVATVPAFQARAATLTAASASFVPEAPGGGTRIDTLVNGERVELEIDPRTSLLDLLRERLDLTGAKAAITVNAGRARCTSTGGRYRPA